MNVPLSTLAQYKTYVLHCANVDSETEEEETSSRDGKKKARLESDYDELFGPHYACKKTLTGSQLHMHRGVVRGIFPGRSYSHNEQPVEVVGTL